MHPTDSDRTGGDPFTTTHWTVVLAAGNRQEARSQEALAALYRKYWRPLYSYARRRGSTSTEAQDLTQEFFTCLLEKDYIRLADPERGRFRCFLLTAFKHFLVNEWQKGQAQKRGGGQTRIMLDPPWDRHDSYVEPAHEMSPEKLYEREWALSVLEHVLARLRAEYARTSNEHAFDVLKGFITGASEGLSYRDAAKSLGTSEGSVKTAVHRLRKRYRDALRDEIAQTVESPNQIEEELRYLFTALSP